MDPVRAKAISIVLLHFWPLFCQRAVCHDSLSLSLPLSLPFSTPVSLSFPCLWHSFYSAVCQSRQQMQWKAKAEPLPDFYSLSLPPLPLALRNLLWKICIIHYAIMNVTMLLLPLSLSLALYLLLRMLMLLASQADFTFDCIVQRGVCATNFNATFLCTVQTTVI